MARQLLAELVLSLRDGLSGPARNVTGALNSIERAALNLARNSNAPLTNWGNGFQRQLDRMRLGASQMREVADSWNRLQGALSNTSGLSALDRSRALDSWRNRTMASLQAVRSEVHRTDSEFARLGSRMARFAAIAGGLGVGVYGAGRAARATARVTSENMREGARDYLGGLSPADSARLGAGALDLSSRFRSVTATNLHSALRETAMLMGGSNGGVDRALTLGPDLARAMVVLQSLNGPQQAQSQIAGFMRAMDTMDRADIENPMRLRNILDGMIRAVGVQGREVNLRDLFTFARRAKTAGSTLSDEFLYLVAPSLMTDMAPETAGRALGSTISQVVNNRGTRASMNVQRRLGIRGREGVHERELLASNPFDWTQRVLIPALQRRGIDLNNNAAVGAAIGDLFSNQSVSDLFTRMVTQRDQIQRDMEQYRRAPGLAAAEELPRRDPFVAWAEATSQLSNAASEAAKPLMESLVPAVRAAADGLNAFARYFNWARNAEPDPNPTDYSYNPGYDPHTDPNAPPNSMLSPETIERFRQLEARQAEIENGIRANQDAEPHTVRGRLRAHYERQREELQAEIAGMYPPRAPVPEPTGLEGNTAYRIWGQVAGGAPMYRTGQPESVPAPQVDTQPALTSIQNLVDGARSQLSIGLPPITPTVDSASAQAAFGALMERLRAEAQSGVTINVRTGGGAGGAPTVNVPGRASGGPVSRGNLYAVGEEGPELFAPGTDGTIIPNHALGGRRVALHLGGINIHGAGDPQAVAQAVMDELSRQARDGLRGIFADTDLV